MAQTCAGHPCTPINVVKAGLSEIFKIDIDNDGMQAGGNRFAMRPTTADSLG
jgi:hypothetical protein